MASQGHVQRRWDKQCFCSSTRTDILQEDPCMRGNWWTFQSTRPTCQAQISRRGLHAHCSRSLIGAVPCGRFRSTVKSILLDLGTLVPDAVGKGFAASLLAGILATDRRISSASSPHVGLVARYEGGSLVWRRLSWRERLPGGETVIRR
jgi:hypothetical protein